MQWLLGEKKTIGKVKKGKDYKQCLLSWNNTRFIVIVVFLKLGMQYTVWEYWLNANRSVLITIIGWMLLVTIEQF